MQKYEKLYESLIPLRMESLEEILITSDTEDDDNNKETIVPVQPSPSPSGLNKEEGEASTSTSQSETSSQSARMDYGPLPSEPVYLCPLDNCRFFASIEVRLWT